MPRDAIDVKYLPGGRIDLDDLVERATEAPPFKDRDGIEGTLKLSGRRPYQKLYFVPTARGRRHSKYLEIKRLLRDDWDTDVSSTDPELWSWYIEHALRGKMP